MWDAPPARCWRAHGAAMRDEDVWLTAGAGSPQRTYTAKNAAGSQPTTLQLQQQAEYACPSAAQTEKRRLYGNGMASGTRMIVSRSSSEVRQWATRLCHAD